MGNLELKYDNVIEMVEKTSRSIFITGKAGTGKTTMLRKIVSRGYKKTVVVAPTGVAAINAEGVTIHSLFQIPPHFVPPVPQSYHSLIAQQRIREDRRKLFRELELLIIDEISMVRADLLDTIDAVLRYYRRQPDLPFGGVQAVFFGDLYQLPPVVVDNEYEMISQFYPNPFFFSSRVVAEMRPAVVELTTIFRQKNGEFVTLLNELRNNTVSRHSLELLESRYDPAFDPSKEKDYIVLTTHNAKADSVNMAQLEKLNSRSYHYKAVIEKDFPEKAYPTDADLVLKEGARVMFVTNDRQPMRRYYNGMIGTVIDIDSEKVIVDSPNSDVPIVVTPETWDNNAYTINKKTNEIEETLIGRFTQMPLRLAWAITIHKSQGLTFDKVVIDSAAAFASGQIYVAFSRCRTLDGIVLTSQVNTSALRVDRNVSTYCQRALTPEQFNDLLVSDRASYGRVLMIDLFDLKPLLTIAVQLYAKVMPHAKSFTEGIMDYVDELKSGLSEIATVSSKFQNQLSVIADDEIQGRIIAASGYFMPKLIEIAGKIKMSHYVTDSRNLADEYLELIGELHDTICKKIFLFDAVAEDCSVENYFEKRRKYVPARLEVKAYAVDVQENEEIENEPLFRLLCSWRREYCSEKDIPAYRMFSTQTLKDVARYLPQNMKQLAKIKGFGKVKIGLFGNECIEMVQRYCKTNNIAFDFDDQE